MSEAKSQIMVQQCICGSVKTEIKFTESEQLVICSICGKVISKFQW